MPISAWPKVEEAFFLNINLLLSYWTYLSEKSETQMDPERYSRKEKEITFQDKKRLKTKHM